MKVVKFKSYTDKKDIVDTVVDNKKFTKILENPFYLSIYSQFLTGVDSSSYKPTENEFTRYSMLKDAFLKRTTIHEEEMKEMGL